jgi:hypothetical protein
VVGVIRVNNSSHDKQKKEKERKKRQEEEEAEIRRVASLLKDPTEDPAALLAAGSVSLG